MSRSHSPPHSCGSGSLTEPSTRLAVIKLQDLLSLSLLLFTELESNKKKRSRKKLEGKLVGGRDKRVADEKQMGADWIQTHYMHV